jgi:esterase/lipase superfamily enzyme
VADVIALQQAPQGVVDLSELRLGKGVAATGMAYLNGGLSLVASRTPITAFNDLQRMKTALTSSLDANVISTFGGRPISMPIDEVPTALQAGAMESAIVNPTGATIEFGHPVYVLKNSVRARVAVVLSSDTLWRNLEFDIRTPVSDSIVKAAQAQDRAQLIAEAQSSQLRFAKATTLDANQVRLGAERWISTQPEASRPAMIEFVNQSTRAFAPASRMAPPRSNLDNVDVWFATTREVTSSTNGRLRFSDVPTDVIKCGTVTLSGENEETASFTYAATQTANTKQCESWLSSIVDQNKPLIIYIHGFNTRFSDAALRAAFLMRQFKATANIVLWSWPSKHEGVGLSYPYDKESAQGIAVNRLVDMLNAVRRSPNRANVTVLAHSMGSWHLVAALRDLLAQQQPLPIANIVFAAPDFSLRDFGFQMTNMGAKKGRVVLYACADDYLLRLSSVLQQETRAGTGGDDIYVGEGVESIDVPSALFSTNHSYIFDPGPVIADVSQAVIDGKGPASRNLDKRVKAGRDYWRIR